MAPTFSKTLFASTLSAMTVPALAVAPPVKVGGEVGVTVQTGFAASHPDVARDAQGNIVVVWEVAGQDGSETGVFARRFDANGVARGGEFRVNDTTAGDQQNARVAMAADGRFVVTFESAIAHQGARDVFARLYTAAGVAAGTAFRVNQTFLGDQFEPDVASDQDGNFVVAWTSDGQDGAAYGVFARRYSSTGTALADEFQVSNVTTGNQSDASVASAADGRFAIAWQDSLADASGTGVFARRFAADGTALAAPFRVNTATTGTQAGPDIGMSAEGAFVISFQDLADRDGDGGGIFARRYNSAGTALGNDFQVNTFSTKDQNDAAVAMDADGDFAVTWSGYGLPDSTTANSFVQRFRADGSAIGGNVQANSTLESVQVFTAAAMDADGDLVTAWSGRVGSDLSAVGMQRFRTLDGIDLAVTQVPATASGTTGGTQAFTVSVSNLQPAQELTGFPAVDAGLGAATGFSVTSTLPSGQSRVNSSGTNWVCGAPVGTEVTCDYGISLAAGETADPLEFDVNVGAQDIVHTATVSSGQRDPRASNNTDGVTVPVACGPSVLRFASAEVTRVENGVAAVQVDRVGSCGAVSVQFDSASRTALAGVDFTDVSGVLTWADGDTTSRTIEIPIAGDALDEANERFDVQLANAHGATIDTPSNAVVTIADNDASPGVTFTKAGQTRPENGVLVTLTAQLSAISGRAVRVPFTLGGNATEGAEGDYVLGETQIEIPAGSLTGSVTIQIVDDALDEANEKAIVTMGTPVNATAGVATVFTLTIKDDDA